MSGPGILRLSAWGARELADKKYQFAIQVNWLNEIDFEEAIDLLKNIKEENSKKLKIPLLKTLKKLLPPNVRSNPFEVLK